MKSCTKIALLFMIAVSSVLQESVHGTPFSSLPSPPTCGQRYLKKPVPSSHIVAGKNAGSWPWQARVLAKWIDGNYNFICGGVLISDWWVMTAAHCIAQKEKAQDVRVVLGEYDSSQDEGTEQYFNATDMRIFDNFSAPFIFAGDFAMIKLDRAVKFSNDIQPICLPNANTRLPVGTECYITGWGYTQQFISHKINKVSKILQEAKVPIADYNRCNKYYSQYITLDNKTMVCVGYGKKKNVSSCSGDSGGPLSCNENGRYFLRGLCSMSEEKCTTVKDTFSVYARISPFIKWIKDQMVSSPPIFPDCQDSHWFCSGYSTKKVPLFGKTHCKMDFIKVFVRKYCPISCKDPKCFPRLKKMKNKKTTNKKI